MGRTWGVVAVLVAVCAAGCSRSGVRSGADAADPTTTTSSSVASTTETTTTTASTTTTDAASAFPAAQWATVDPSTAGFDVTALDRIVSDAQAAGSNCFLVARDGRIVTEQYWNGTGPDSAQEVFSASKSVTSVLAGIAHHDGDLEVDDLASTYIPEWAGTPSESVTVEQLLSNDSGREHDAATDYVQMAAKAPGKTAFSIGLSQVDPPGTVWAYNNAAIQTLEAVLSSATGEDVADFAASRLFGPTGMSDSSIRRDRSGNPLTFMGVQSTCRDMARLGVLMLHDGEWDGTTIIDPERVQDSTGHSSQDLNAAYGWLWWLNRPGTVLGARQATGDAGGAGTDAAPVRQLAPGAPEDMFWALGFGNQVVAVDPGSDTVVVRLGPSSTPEGTPEFDAPASARVVTEALVPQGR